MKKCLGFGFVLLLIILCCYYGMGVGTERILRRNIEVVNQSPQIQVALQHYQRGWFRSHAQLTWTIEIPQSSNQNPQRTTFNQKKEYHFDVPLTIYHGPIIWTHSKLYLGLGYAQARAHLPDSVEQAIAKNYKYNSAKFEYVVRVFVNYLNKTTVQFQIPQCRLSQKNGDNFFQWLGLISNMVISGDNQNLQGDVALKGFSWKELDMRGVIGPFEAKYDLKKTLGTLYIGTGHVKLPSFSVFVKDQAIFRINDAQINSSSSIQQGLYDSSFSANINQLTLRDKNYARTKFDLAFKNLDANVLVSINQKLNNMQPNGHDRQRILWALIPDLPALLSKGAELSLNDFEINTLAGQVKFDLHLALPKESFTNPLQIIQKIKGESHLTVSEPLFKQWIKDLTRKAMLAKAQKQSLNKEMQASQTPNDQISGHKPAISSITSVENIALSETLVSTKTDEKIKEWISAGILVQGDRSYTILSKLMDGKLFINGHPFDQTLLTLGA